MLVTTMQMGLGYTNNVEYTDSVEKYVDAQSLPLGTLVRVYEHREVYKGSRSISVG